MPLLQTHMREICKACPQSAQAKATTGMRRTSAHVEYTISKSANSGTYPNSGIKLPEDLPQSQSTNWTPTLPGAADEVVSRIDFCRAGCKRTGQARIGLRTLAVDLSVASAPRARNVSEIFAAQAHQRPNVAGKCACLDTQDLPLKCSNKGYKSMALRPHHHAWHERQHPVADTRKTIASFSRLTNTKVFGRYTLIKDLHVGSVAPA